jgi:Lon protease-like protein
VSLSPAFPLGTAFLPGDAVVLRVFEARYLEMMTVVLEGNRQFVSALIAGGSEVGGGDHRFNEGVLVEIDRIEEADIGLMLYGRATTPINIRLWNDDASYPRAQYEHQTHQDNGTEVSEADVHLIAALAHDLEDFFSFLSSLDIPVPVPPQFVRSLLPQTANEMTANDAWSLFWSLARLLPSAPMARGELLRDQPLQARVRRAQEEIEHLRDLVRFRYGN